MSFVTDTLGTPGAYEAIAPSTAKGITAAILSPVSGEHVGKSAAAALITVEGGSLRFTLEGTAPTTTVGHLLAEGESLLLRGKRAIKQFQCIDESVATSVKVTTYF